MTSGDELGLRTLVVDDEAPARDELSYLLVRSRIQASGGNAHPRRRAH